MILERGAPLRHFGAHASRLRPALVRSDLG